MKTRRIVCIVLIVLLVGLPVTIIILHQAALASYDPSMLGTYAGMEMLVRANRLEVARTVSVAFALPVVPALAYMCTNSYEKRYQAKRAARMPQGQSAGRSPGQPYNGHGTSHQP